MKKKKALKKVAAGKVKIFRIANRKGYAAVCMNNLTEGRTPYQAYDRMEKALKRGGCALREIGAAQAKNLVKNI